ncbi:MAG: phenylalanine--tRNA ligase subunit beta [Caldithrix sp.]|nr:phenylalanine--tRNA ligase subunit beta [Caldithrix sp.]
MKVSYKWLKDYIDIKQSPAELADALTEAGLEVEELIPQVPYFNGVIAGKVTEVAKHPNADKLSVCKVITSQNEKAEEHQVICGAPNVAEGQYIPFAAVGATLPKGFKIKKVKIRGVTSSGMICSKEELGLESSSEGIWAFDEPTPLGTDIYPLLKDKEDYILDIAVTPNRPDCLSIIGVAREIAALTGNALHLPDINVPDEKNKSAQDLIHIAIEDASGCHRYAARIISDVTIDESPTWIQKRLEAVGLRPINNVVDITNFVLMEMGHPLHAFDMDRLKGPEINVRSSSPGDTFTTLDDKERVLPENTVMICDNTQPVAIGGIMGGQNSEVTAATRNILLESAYFKPERIAVASKKLGLTSDASQRFERGADIENIITALNRAASLLAEYAHGKVLQGVVDEYPRKHPQKKVSFRPEQVNRLLGSSFEDSFIIDTLKRLQLNYKNGVVEVPSFRVDIAQEADLVEEVARLVNYSNLPSKQYTNIQYDVETYSKEEELSFLKTKLIELGMMEIVTNSMLKNLEAKPFYDGNLVHIMNPISDDMTTMRPSLIPGMLKTLAYNINRSNNDLKIFELGRVFLNYRVKDIPEQPYRLAVVMTGNRFEENWAAPGELIDFYDIKGILESFVEKIFLDNFQFILYDASNIFSANETIALQANEKIIGYCGRLNEAVTSHFDIDVPVYGFEIDVNSMLQYMRTDRRYQPVSRYPFSERDMAIVIDRRINAGDILKLVKEEGGHLLQRVKIFDVYRGDKIPEDKQSLAIRLRFQSNERTLSDSEVDAVFTRIVNKAKQKYNAYLRK